MYGTARPDLPSLLHALKKLWVFCGCSANSYPIWITSGKYTKNYGQSSFEMGKSTISMAMFKFTNCKRLPEGTLVTLQKNPITCFFHVDLTAPSTSQIALFFV